MRAKIVDFKFSSEEKKLLNDLFDFTLNPGVPINDPVGDKEVKEVWDSMKKNKLDKRILGYLEGWIIESSVNPQENKILKSLIG